MDIEGREMCPWRAGREEKNVTVRERCGLYVAFW